MISADGQRVAFRSDATNLAPGGSYKGFYVRDLASGQTSYVAIQSGIPLVGEHWLAHWSFSPDLRYLAYAPTQDNYCWLYDHQTGQTEKVGLPQPGGSQGVYGDVHNPTVSADGRFVVFGTAAKLDPRDANSFRDIYMRDRELAQTICVSCPPGRAERQPQRILLYLAGRALYRFCELGRQPARHRQSGDHWPELYLSLRSRRRDVALCPSAVGHGDLRHVGGWPLYGR